MSWDGYIDTITGQSADQCDQACIIGLSGGGKWTTDAHEKSFKLTAEEAVKIASVIESGNMTAFQASGLMAAGLKYTFLREDPEEKLVLAKKKDHGSLTLQATGTAIIIGHTIEGGVQGTTNQVVASIVAYLKQNGI